MLACFAETGADAAIPIYAVSAAELDDVLGAAPPELAAFAGASEFKAKPGQLLIAPAADGGVDRVLVGVGEGGDPFVLGALPRRLPQAAYRIAAAPPTWSGEEMALAWALGAYVFDRYKSADRDAATLAPPDGCDMASVERAARATWLVRDLVNTPANDMGPRGLEAAFDALTEEFNTDARMTVGGVLPEQGYPLVHAVGRAAAEEPRVLELEWGEEDAPRIAVIGKGVCFDSGGLNIKTGDFMRLMKKDMGGAAHAFALAQMIMSANLPCRLHLVVPAVENAIASNAFRPGDILESRAGLTIEIENTDAEGRLVLADALARAAEFEPDLIIDFATLTGAARVALGAELAPYYASDDDLAATLETAAAEARDPVWRMPLWQGYAKQVESPIADLKNLGDGALGGSITAALFLQRFTKDRPWIHFDVFAWNPKDRPAHPRGGEAQGLRAAFAMVKARLST